MDSKDLANLRRKRRYIHRQLDRWEPLVTRLRESLAETEAAIQEVAPELNLPPRRYQPNPIFDRGEMPRLMREIMREAGEPVSTLHIALKALARKGLTFPTPRQVRRTRLQIGKVFAIWGPEKVQKVGRNKATKRALIS